MKKIYMVIFMLLVTPILLVGCVEESSKYVDFSSYEHGPIGDQYIEIDKTTISIIDAPRSADSYVREIGNQPYGEFDIVFEITISKLEAATGGSGSGFVTVAFVREEGSKTFNKMWENEDGILLFFRTWNENGYARLVNRNYAWNTDRGVGPEMRLISGFIDQKFYVHYWREMNETGSILNVAFYDDEALSVPSVYITPHAAQLPLFVVGGIHDQTTFDYFIPACGRENIDDLTYLASATLENFLMS